MEFRRAMPAELDAVTELYWQTIDGLSGREHSPGWIKEVYPTRAFLADALEQGTIWGLWDGSRYVAAMVLNHRCGDGYDTVHWAVEAEPEQVLVIHLLAVLPQNHGQGLGTRMVREAEALGRQQGCRAIRLDVLQCNEPALRFYPRVGFSYRGTVRLFYENTGLTDFLLYEAVL